MREPIRPDTGGPIKWFESVFDVAALMAAVLFFVGIGWMIHTSVSDRELRRNTYIITCEHGIDSIGMDDVNEKIGGGNGVRYWVVCREEE